MKVNIKLISELSGYSPATVSNALNNKRGVSRETSEKILKIAEEYGYSSNSKISSVKLVAYKDQSSTAAETPYFTELMEGIDEECRKYGYTLELCNLNKNSGDYEIRLQEILTEPNTAIILLATELSEQESARFLNAKAPLVVVDALFEANDFDTVASDNSESVYKAVNYLLNNGHTHIGYIRSKTRVCNFTQREIGFKRALAAGGAPIDLRFIFEVTPTLDNAFRDMETYINENRAMPTAFFADNDVIAIGAMKALIKHGYKIPEDISVIGFGNLPFCRISSPELTTISVNQRFMGKAAVVRIFQKITMSNAAIIKINVCNTFIERGSCGKAPY